MNDWYQRMVAALQLNGKGEPTQKAYTRALRMLCGFYNKTPDLKALSKIFRAKFRDLMKQRNLFDQIPNEVWQVHWNVNCQAVGSSAATLKMKLYRPVGF